MRKPPKLLLLLSLILCCAGIASAACSDTSLGYGAECIEIVAGQNSGGQCDVTNNCHVTLTPTNLNDTVILSVVFTGSVTVSSILDNAYGGSDTYTTAVTQTTVSTTLTAYTSGMKAGVTSVTVTLSGSAPGAFEMTATHLSGLSATPLDVAIDANNAGSSAPSVGPSSATATANEYVSCFVYTALGIVTLNSWGNSLTQEYNANDHLAVADKVLSTTGAQTCSATLSGSNYWDAQLTTWKFTSAPTYTVGVGKNYSTISACAAVVTAGDTCQIFAGTYNETPSLAASGTSGNPIAFITNPGDTVTVTGFNLNNNSYITIQGSPSAHLIVTGAITWGYTTHDIFQYITDTDGNAGPCLGGSGWYSTTTASSYNQFLNLTLAYCGGTTNNDSGAIELEGHYNLFDHLNISYGQAGVTLSGQFNVIRNSTFGPNSTAVISTNHSQPVESSIATGDIAGGTQHLLYEDNYSAQWRGPNSHGTLLNTDVNGLGSTSNVVRLSSTMDSGSYGIQVYDSLKSYFYNDSFSNTQLDNSPKDLEDYTLDPSAPNSRTINNIFANMTRPATTDWCIYADATPVENHNLCFMTGYSGSWYGPTTASSNTYDASDIFNQDPKFAAPDTNLALLPSSPALTAGSYLTTAVGLGTTSTALTVVDAGFFFANAGMPGNYAADWIRIGASTTVQISSIDYSTNVITLATAVSWVNGAGVYLYEDSSGIVQLPAGNPGLGAFPNTGLIVTATPVGPNHIDLTWAAASNPGYGYLVEIQSPGDSRYSSYTQYRFTPNASGDAGDQNTDPTCAFCYQPPMNGGALPTWVVEPQYVDWLNGGAPAQAIISGLMPNVTYNFRIRTFQYYTHTLYSAYSTPTSATTLNYTLRYVSTTGNDSNGGTNPTTDAWLTLYHAGQTATAGQCVIIEGGIYNDDYLWSANNGTAPVGDHIVFLANPGSTVTMTGSPYQSIFFTNAYNVADGINIVNNYSAMTNQIALTGAVGYDAIFGGNVDSKNGGYGIIVSSDHNLVQGVYNHDTGHIDVDEADNMDIICYAGSGTASYNLTQYNHFTRGAHGNWVAKNGNCAIAPVNNETLNNIADGGWGNAWEEVDQCYQCGATTPPVNHDLEEGNIAAYTWANHGMQTDFKEPFTDEGNYDTIRRNIAFLGVSNGLETNNFEQSTVHGLFYNNIIYRQGEMCWWFGTPAAGQVYTGHTYSNNICTKNYPGGSYGLGLVSGTLIAFEPSAYETDITISYNDLLFYTGGITPAPTTAIITVNAGATYITAAYAEANNNPPFAHNSALSVDPQYLSESGLDFHLLTGSPMIGAATSVTDTTWGTISNTNLGAFDGSFAAPQTAVAAAPVKRAILFMH
jgi:hypothetical protein